MDEALLEEIGFDDLFQGVALLGKRRRQGLDADRSTAIVIGKASEIAPVHGVETAFIHLQPVERGVGGGGVDRRRAGDRGEIAHPAQQPGGDPGGAAGAPRDLAGAVILERHAQHPGAAPHDPLQFVDIVEVEPQRDAEALSQGIGDEAGARRRADEGEGRQLDAHGPRARPLADHEVELKILHRRVEDFLDRRLEPVHLVDEQYVPGLEIGQDGGKIAGPQYDRPGSGVKADTEFAGDDLGQGRLAETRRPRQHDVIERLGAAGGGGDEHPEVVAHLGLAGELGKGPRAKGRFLAVGGGNFRRDGARVAHDLASLMLPLPLRDP